MKKIKKIMSIGANCMKAITTKKESLSQKNARNCQLLWIEV